MYTHFSTAITQASCIRPMLPPSSSSADKRKIASETYTLFLFYIIYSALPLFSSSSSINLICVRSKCLATSDSHSPSTDLSRGGLSMGLAPPPPPRPAEQPHHAIFLSNTPKRPLLLDLPPPGSSRATKASCDMPELRGHLFVTFATLKRRCLMSLLGRDI